MASTQSAPNLAPPNGANPGQGQGVNPLQNLTGDQVKDILQKLRQMKASMDAKGIRVEDLPSDKKERYKYFLSVYVQVMAYQQKKNAAANGAQGQNPSAPSASGANQGQPQNTGQKAPTVSGGPWSKAQYDLYRHQQMLHEKAKNNQPLTAADIQSLQEYTSVVAPSRVKAVKEAEKVVENAEKGSIEPATSNGDAVPKQDWYKNMELPSVLSGQINYQKYRIRKNRPSVPGSWPYGLDTQEIRARRQEVVIHAMARRRDELAQQSASIGVWDTGKTDAPTRDDSLKIQVYNELAALDKYAKQQQLRDAISREMFHYSQGMTANRSIHRRLKKPTLREARVTESLEKQQREARDTREKKKQYDQLQAILQHGQELVNASTQNRARSQKLGRMMVSHHQYMEKEEQRRVERTAKQRLQALKANDEETYMKLLGQAKDSRISHLLNQTDKFLKELAASVRRQQRNQAERYGEDDEEEEEEEEELADSDIDESTQDPNKKKIDYYAVAHRIREQVTEQPSILVGGSLKEYQLKGLQWMISLYNNNLNGILADEMGLGKTIQTISLITHIIEKKRNNGPFLVIVPLSTLTNWNIEFDKWAPSVTKVVYKGPPNARKQQQQQIRWGNFQVLLTTYEYIIKDRPILSKIKWTHMIVDEGHRMKNANSKLSSTLSSYYNSRYRLILTGTPLQNNLPELWALLNFVLPNIFKSVKSFDEWFNTPFANTGGQDRMDLSEEEQLLVIRRLHKVLRPFLLRRLKKDVEKDLPDKQERVIKCRFSALQAKLYKQLVTHNKIAVGDGKGGKTGMRGLSNMLMQLRKLCNHPFVFEPVEDQMNPTRMTNDLLWRTAGKFELLDRILPKFRATGHRVLMFFQMTQIMNIMEDFLRMRGLKYLRLDGSTKSDDRSDLLKVFNDPNSEYFCFLLSTRAGGLGLNLQTADTVIIYDSDWNPHQDLQAQDRAHRIGQKNEVRILRLISSNSVEEKILERAQFKLDMDGKVIQAGKFDNKSTNEERDALLRTLLDTAEAADQVGEQEEMDDDDLNEIMSRSEEEVKIFQEMDKQRALTGTYGPGKRYPRLMCEEELPDIYLQEDNPITEDVEAEVYGRGARERKVTRYDDGLSEQQFLDAMEGLEEGRLTLDQVIERNERRAAERAARKDKKHKRAAGLPDSSPEPSVVDEESETPQKKQGRRRGPPPKRKAEEPPIEENPQPKRKRGRQPKIPETLSSADRATLTRIVTSTIQTLKEMEQEIPTEGSDSEEEPLVRAIIDPFMKPPPRSQYPDYYMIIKNPIAMEQIEKKLKRDDYQSLKEFRDDVHLLCQNARTYNEDGSILFQDANDIEAKCVMELKKQSEGHPEFSNFDDPGSIAGDGVSTGGASGTDTPLTAGTPGAQPKLKLTFNNSNFDSGSTANGTEPSLDEE